jgi:hypothetical protein
MSFTAKRGLRRLLHLVFLLMLTSGFDAEAQSPRATVPIQHFYVLDTIVGLPVEYLDNGGLIIRHFTDSLCFFVAAQDNGDASILKVRLDGMVVDTLEFDLSRSDFDLPEKVKYRGILQTLTARHRSVVLLFDSTLVVTALMGDTLAWQVEHVKPPGYNRIDWLNDSIVILHPAAYHHPRDLLHLDEIVLFNVQTGKYLAVKLPDEDAAVFRLFQPHRFIAAFDDEAWYLRPTDGTLFRLSKTYRWQIVVDGLITARPALQGLVGLAKTREYREGNKFALIDTIDVLLNDSNCLYASYMLYDRFCRTMFVCVNQGEDTSGTRRDDIVYAFNVDRVSETQRLIHDSPWKNGVLCDRTTFPVELAIGQCEIAGDYLYKLGYGFDMQSAYQEGVLASTLREEERIRMLQEGARYCITRYKIQRRCLE